MDVFHVLVSGKGLVGGKNPILVDTLSINVADTLVYTFVKDVIKSLTVLENNKIHQSTLNMKEEMKWLQLLLITAAVDLMLQRT